MTIGIGQSVVSVDELGGWSKLNVDGSKQPFDVRVPRGTPGDVYEKLPNGWLIVRFYTDVDGDAWTPVAPAMVAVS